MRTPLISVLVMIGMCLHIQVISQVDVPKDTQLKEHFSSFELQKAPKGNKKSSEAQVTLDVRINPDEVITLSLQKSSLVSSDHKIVLASGERYARTDLIGTSYTGAVKGNTNSDVRITIKDEYIYGYVSLGKEKYFIEPAYKFDPSLSKEFIMIYQASDVKQPKHIVCASTHEASQKQKMDRELKSSGTCRIADVAIAIDYSYVQDYGSVNDAINQSIAVLNMVAGSYEGAFADDVRFEISEHFVSDCSTCDPWTSSTDANVLLDNFTSWGPTGFTTNHDIGHFWTNRDMCSGSNCSVAGLAWINAICSNQRYLILEDFTTTAWQLRVLVAHEMGHSFGSDHDASGSPFIMAPSISNDTEDWSSTSVNVINNTLPNYTCMIDCVIGSCTEILSATASDCTQGSPSTYTLTLEVRHGGGGTSSSFDVLIDGQSYTQAWSSSPQTVVIPGLEADGITGKSITIEADDNSDNGCGAATVFDAPSPDCSILVTENFDNCNLPSGWTTASTNVFTWNGGDPLVQYEWKFDDATRQFANYDDQGNASSLLTIDGSCMALMDDDIINHASYTGDVTMTSSFYDVSGVDTLQLRFDYNFHTFEDGKGQANNSYFQTEVFDGTNWVVVLHDEDSVCPWSDVWPSTCAEAVDIDISSYINDNFAVRFIFSDGNDGAWAGMIALDNVEIRGTVESAGSSASGPTCEDGVKNGDETGIDCGGTSCDPCDECVDMVVVSSPTNASNYEARNLIMTSGPVSLDQVTVFSADNTDIHINFEVLAGTAFSVTTDGCE